jgi:Ni/Fe-hydrogenase subunit HybB-like protein
MENITTLATSHPIVTIIAAWLALEFTVYVLISFGLIAPHLRRGFSWPVRAIRNARNFF